jgi:hypothetical protein
VQTKHDVIQGAGLLEKNDIMQGHVSSTGMSPDHKVNKVE